MGEPFDALRAVSLPNGIEERVNGQSNTHHVKGVSLYWEMTISKGATP